MHLVISLIFFVISLSGCFGQIENQNNEVFLRVFVVNFPDLPQLPLSVQDYQRHFFDDTGHYQISPEGRPLAGSVRQWFLQQSGQKFSIQGSVHGPFRSLESWGKIMENNALYERTAKSGNPRGESWFAALQRVSEQTLVANGLSVSTNEKFIVIHNGSQQAFVLGNMMAASGILADRSRDITSLGVLTHELGHLLLNQPDRYTYTWGGLQGWDNMASNYDHFPPGYTAEGRVTARWADWADFAPEQDDQVDILNLSAYDRIPRYRARLDGFGSEVGFFTLEHRRRQGAERHAALPAEGVMLFESDPESLRTVAHEWSARENRLADTEGARLIPHRTFNDQIALGDTFRTWALPYGDRRNFLCSDGTSLNVLGECLWEFRNLNLVQNGSQTAMRTEVHWKAKRFPGLSLTLDPSSHGRRLYFKTKQAFEVQFLNGRGYPTQTYQKPVNSQVVQYVLDLDGLEQGGTIRFRGPTAQELADVHVVDKSLSDTQVYLNSDSAKLRNGTVWLTSVASVRPHPTRKQIFTVPLSGFQNRADSDGSNFVNYRVGGVRLVLAYANDRGALPSAEEYEDLIITFCPLGSSSEVLCRESFAGRIPANRTTPFVVMIPYWTFRVRSSQISEPFLSIQRGFSSSRADLVLLSASVELDPDFQSLYNQSYATETTAQIYEQMLRGQWLPPNATSTVPARGACQQSFIWR